MKPEEYLPQEMKIVFQNGSTWQLMGSDNYDSLVGSPPVGLTYPELRPYYTKEELVSELIWIQEFLEELGAFDDIWNHHIYEEVSNGDLCRKYAESLDKVLYTLKPEIYEK